MRGGKHIEHNIPLSGRMTWREADGRAGGAGERADEGEE